MSLFVIDADRSAVEVKQERDEERLEFQPSVNGIWSLQGQPGSRRRRCSLAACSDLRPLDVDDRITGADDEGVVTKCCACVVFKIK